MTVTSSRTADKFVVRLDDGMRSSIQAIAKKCGRSMNSEIVIALRDMIRRADLDPTAGELTELLNSLNVKPWTPRVGDLVRRRDTGRAVGSITEFILDNPLGLQVILTDGSRHFAALLEPIDITDIIAASGSTVHTALYRISVKDK